MSVREPGTPASSESWPQRPGAKRREREAEMSVREPGTPASSESWPQRPGAKRREREAEMSVAARTLCVWCPDWPVATVRRAQPELVGVPVAVVDRVDGRVVVCAASHEARQETVAPGLRRRD